MEEWPFSFSDAMKGFVFHIKEVLQCFYELFLAYKRANLLEAKYYYIQ